MAKKVSGSEAPELPKVPYPVGDRAAFIRKAAVAVDIVQVPTALVVTYSIAYGRVEVAHIPVSEIKTDSQAKAQYYLDGGHISGGPPSLAKTHLSWLRSMALANGATPEAVRLLSKATSAFTKKEEAQMAEKLKSKAAAKPRTNELKDAAKETPVGGKKASAAKPTKSGDNLAKARAAKASAGPDTRKIKALKKAKDISARDGSFRHRMLTDLLASKTVQEFREKDKAYDAGCLRFAQEAGYIDALPAK